jgi:hypothetical protein
MMASATWEILLRPTRSGSWTVLLGIAAFLATAKPTAAQDVPVGDGRQSATISGVTLTIYTYRPAGCALRLVLLTFHGVGRDADGYRNHAKPMADAVCAIVFAPLFDRARFENAKYQHGGVGEDGVAAPAGARTIDLVPPLADWARAALGQPGLPYAMIGHSAGAQFLDRVAAFMPNGAAHLFIANPSTWVLPTTDVAVPFGFGGVPHAEAALRAYLALPITVLLGTADLLTKELDMSPQGMTQGPDRYHRGLRAFAMAQAAAKQHGWAFGWELREVPNVGHNAGAMFTSPQAVDAIVAAARTLPLPR